MAQTQMRSVGPLARSVTVLWGVGPERGAQLARLGIRTIEDLLLHRPRRYEDRRQVRPIGSLRLGEAATTRGRVVAMGTKLLKDRRRTLFELVIEDATGRLHCRWWNLPFMEQYFRIGSEVFVFGKLTSDRPPTMDHPETEVVESDEEDFVHLNRIVPVYPLTEGLSQRWLRSLVWRALNQYEAQISEPWAGAVILGAGGLAEARATPRQLGLGEAEIPAMPPRARAIRMLHFPESLEDVEVARRRLALDEFIALQCQMQARRKRFESRATALPCGGTNLLIKPFLARLGFSLTEAQKRVLREIRRDMAGRHPMRRLLQGDVGSGKTVVAACTTLMAIESGYSVALMAPTEILAEQHYQTFKRWFDPLGVPVELLTGSRKTVAPGLADRGNREADGEAPRLFVGTHALIEAGFAPRKLGLVIIDEQHKFGVAQRERLVRKGNYPHLLVMTATPIPRTLGLTLYGDLDVSVIDELPPGRGTVKTIVRTQEELPAVWEFIRSRLAEGRQAYVVYPRVEEDEAGTVKAVTKEFNTLKKVFLPYKTGLLHGRLAPRQKEQVLAEFRDGKLHVLLATALVEVGLDVPNATVMLVENAERFGLAQLHQLRGRIGRGAHESYCILVMGAATPEAQERLKVLELTNDGFAIAEADLKLRGPGELLGLQQSGMPRFKFGELTRDFELVRYARAIARWLVYGSAS
ncbi:MAG: ATP-dependent DNA helicase RecG [Verrucomicrobiae bacterium]|nr:ATP-dependent DNA helicase RecG [Verrucomicrobiae bacterium]